MAKKFLTGIDLNKNELQNAVIQSLATAPASGTAGQIYYNSTDKKLYQYDGTSWVCVGMTYSMEVGTASNNVVPIKLYANGQVQDTVNITGAGGATVTSSDNTITITASGGGSSITYTFTGSVSSTAYVITCTPSSGTAQTVTIPLADGTNAGLMSPSDYTKLSGIASGAEVNVQSDWSQSDNTADDYIKNKPTVTNYDTGTDSDLSTGTSTTAKVWTPKVLHDHVASVVGGIDAMVFKGTLGTGGTITSLPSTHKKGDTYRVIEAGTYAGQTAEVGDLIIAITTSGTTSSDWTVAQTNIDGAITSSTTNTSNWLAKFTGDKIVANGIEMTAKQAASGGTDLTLVTTGEKYTWNSKASTDVATQSANGLMSSTDKTKLDGIAISKGKTTLATGNTSITVSNAYTILGYTATQGDEEVLVDFEYTSSDYPKWTIASAASSAITIEYIYYEAS